MNALCILFADNFRNFDLNELSSERTVASVPFGGRYRLVDFVLSSLVAAKIHHIGIITRNKYGSLMDHISWGKDWDLNRKNGGIKFLTPFLRNNNSSLITNEIEALSSVIDYIKNSIHDYVILCDSNIIMNIDFKSLIDYHENKDADITFAYKSTKSNIRELEVTLNEDGQLTDALFHQYSHNEEKNIQLNILVLKKDLLISLIEKGVTYGWNSIKMNVIAHEFNNYKIYGYKVKGYASIIKTVEDFYKANMDLLNKEVRLELFHSKNPVLTRIKDSVPTMYGENAEIVNSLIADGANINGTVENSIIFRDVKIKKGAVIKNSILMQGTVVEENSMLSGVITDKDVVVNSERILAGTGNKPFIINKGKIV